MKKMKTITLIAAMLLTVCLSSCMERREISGSGFYSDDKNDVTEIISAKKVFNLREADVEKKTRITIDEVKQLISESEQLYKEYDEIILSEGQSIIMNEKIKKGMGLDCSLAEYYDYLDDLGTLIMKMIFKRVSPELSVSEYDLGIKHIMTKNSNVFFGMTYLNVFSEELNFNNPKDMFDNYWDKNNEFDILFYNMDYDFITYKGEVLLPNAEQRATLEAIEAREIEMRKDIVK